MNWSAVRDSVRNASMGVAALSAGKGPLVRMTGRKGSAAANGRIDPAHLEALARRHQPALRRYFERRLPHIGAEADDLVQEVFVRLAQRADRDEIANVEGYLFQVA